MNNWIPKNKTVKFAYIVAITSIVLYSGSLLFVFMEIKKIENFYYDTESESSKKERFWAIKSLAEKNSEPIRVLRDFFIKKDDEVKFIEQIEETARASAVNFEILSIDVKPGKADSIKEDVEVGMKVEGSWGSVMDFLNKLEKMPFGVFIQNTNLDVNPPDGWSGSVKFIVFREK